MNWKVGNYIQLCRCMYLPRLDNFCLFGSGLSLPLSVIFFFGILQININQCHDGEHYLENMAQPFIGRRVFLVLATCRLRITGDHNNLFTKRDYGQPQQNYPIGAHVSRGSHRCMKPKGSKLSRSTETLTEHCSKLSRSTAQNSCKSGARSAAKSRIQSSPESSPESSPIQSPVQSRVQSPVQVIVLP